MNKIILGATLVAIAALVGTPLLAEAVEDLYGLKVQMDNAGNFDTIVFMTLADIPEDGSVIGGYAIPTENGDFIAVTSHRGIADSEAQTDANDPIWHSHLVKASPNASRCIDVAIDALSFEEPSAFVVVRDEPHNTIVVRTIANGTSFYTDAISGSSMEFTVGNPIVTDIPDGSPGGKTESISFDLNEALDRTICMGETKDLVIVNPHPTG